MTDMSTDSADESEGRIEALARAWDILVDRAREGRTITYGEMATALRLSPQSSNFTSILSEVSRSEVAAGRGMLSVLVVRQRQGLPGVGFFNLAREVGRKFENESLFFLEESERVIAHWQGRAAEELDVLHDDVVKDLERIYATESDEALARRQHSWPQEPGFLLKIFYKIQDVIGAVVSAIVRLFRRILRRGA